MLGKSVKENTPGEEGKENYVFLNNSGKHADLKLYVPVGPELLHPSWG